MSLPDIFKKVESKLIALTDEVTIMKEASFALQHIEKNKLLKDSTIESKQKALVNVVQIGLTFNPVAKECYLVPRWNRQLKKNECHAEPSYVGLVKLLTDAGSVIKVNSQIVYKGDDIEIDLGESRVKHTPYSFLGNDKGEIIGCYAIAYISDNVRQLEWMTKDELYEIRSRSESYKAYIDPKKTTVTSSIWASDETEMMRKTAIRRIYKYLPRTKKMEKIDEAIKLDSFDYMPSAGKIGLIESLIDSGKFTDQEKEDLRLQIDTINNKTADEMIKYLEQHQPTFQDGNPSNRELHKELDNKMNDHKS